MEPNKLKERFTEVGYEDLTNRLNSLKDLFNDNKFPFEGIMFGFPKLTIDDREECFGRILELSQILGVQVKMYKENNNYSIELGIGVEPGLGIGVEPGLGISKEGKE